jgi:hypothetical protein
MKEMSGIIIKLFDSCNGIILGQDNNEYYFSKMDFLYNFDIKEKQSVAFKPNELSVNDAVIYKATMISE